MPPTRTRIPAFVYRDVYTGIHTVVAASVEFSVGEAFCANTRERVCALRARVCVHVCVYVSGVRSVSELSGAVDKGGYLVDWRRNSTSFWKFFPIEGRRNHIEIEMKTEIEILFVHIRVNISSEFSKQRRSMEIWKKKKEITVSFRRVRRAKTRASRERNPG